MTFKLQFDTDNAAFEHSPGAVVASTLREVAHQVERGRRSEGPIMDENGNKIGEWEWEN